MALAHLQSIAKARVSNGLSAETAGVTTSGGSGILLGTATFFDVFSSVSDSKTATWALDAGPVSYNNAGIGVNRIHSNLNPTGAQRGASHTFTVTLTSSDYAVLGVVEFSGQHTAGLDKTASQTSSSDTIVESGTTATTAEADEFLFAVMSSSTAVLTTISDPSDSFTAAQEEEDAATYVLFASAWRIVAATGAYSTTWTLGVGRNTCGLIATYKAAAGGPNQQTLPATEGAGGGMGRGVKAFRQLNYADVASGDTTRRVFGFRTQPSLAIAGGTTARTSALFRSLSGTYSPSAAVSRLARLWKSIGGSVSSSAATETFFGRVVNLVATMIGAPSLSRFVAARRTQSYVNASHAAMTIRLFRSLQAAYSGFTALMDPFWRSRITLAATVQAVAGSLRINWNMALGAVTNAVASLVYFVGAVRLLQAVEAALSVTARWVRVPRALPSIRTPVAGLARRLRGIRTLASLEAPFGLLGAIWRRPVALAASLAESAGLTRTVDAFRSFAATVASAAFLSGLKRGTFILLTSSATTTADLVRFVSARVGLAASVVSSAAASRFVSAFRSLAGLESFIANLASSAQSAITLAAVQVASATLTRLAVLQRTVGALFASAADLTIGSGARQFTLGATAAASAAISRAAFLWRTIGATVQSVGLLAGRFGFFPFQQPLTVRSLLAERTLREV